MYGIFVDGFMNFRNDVKFGIWGSVERSGCSTKIMSPGWNVECWICFMIFEHEMELL